MPKVAVLMPARNASLYIEEAIGSILAQRAAAEFDIIVVDDGSTDNTAQIVRELSRSAPEVRLIAQPHRGVPAARNAALDALTADTDVITFLDADDLSPPDRFARDLGAFLGAPAIDVHWGMTQRFAGKVANSAPPARPSLERGSQLGAVMIKPGKLREVGRFNEALPSGEDVDFLLRLLESRPNLALTAEAAVLYRVHGTNLTRNGDLVRSALIQVYLSAAYRRRHGAPPVPPGLFQPLGGTER